jgi:thioredoxin 1
MVKEVNFMNITDEVLHFKGRVLVYFSSAAFPLCKVQDGEFKAFSETENAVKCVNIISDKSPDLSMLYGIMSAPTMVLFENGKEIKRTSEVLKKEEIAQFVK